MPKLQITKSRVDVIEPSSQAVLYWDSTLSGFGLKVMPSGIKTYIVQYRTSGGRRGTTRRVTIGRHGSPWTPDLARAEAKRVLASVVQGNDPALLVQVARSMPTVSELCERYLKEGVGVKKQSTLATDRGRIKRHIIPLLGKLRLDEVTQPVIRRFLEAVAEGKTAVNEKTKLRGRAIVRGGRGTASRTLGLLGGIFSFAVDLNLVDSNPVHGVKRFPDKKNERFLTEEEISRVAAALHDAEREGGNASGIAVLRLLIFTGARRGEIEGLKWSEVDFVGRRLKLADSKTGQKQLPLNVPALEILQTVTRPAEGSKFVFPASSGDGHFRGTPRVWAKMREKLGMQDVRIHDFRHSFASIGVANGTPLIIVGALLGHANHSTTQRYAHLTDNPVTAAAEQIGAALKAAFALKIPKKS